ncbi:phospholipase A1-Ibeta2, chloroplastic-like [Typha angustifolia]|uniref:phospholipase A1-Ibeta2, chloroplastic-like n=1 Tax=Typha angustifolia TaxID=59011 RepID=UPI003C2C3990
MPVIGAVATPPRQISPSRATTHRRPHSPLNPHSCSLKTTTSSSASTVTTKTHLSNLDRVLLKPSTQLTTIPPLPQTKPTTQNNKNDQPSQDQGIFNALNLSSIFKFPFARLPMPEEASPRSLNYIQRLLSESPRLSPKNSIASRWRRYHGGDQWKGLLDPLDENLRRELLRYGDFVQYAYHAFHSIPSSSAATSPSSHRHRHLILPDRNYRPTRSLFATSALSLPTWAQPRNAPSWLTQQSSWIGYVAVCDSEREIQRMGRRDIVIVLRGTATCPEWAENLRTTLTPLSSDSEGESEGDSSHVPKVARGFLSLYKTAGEHAPSLSTTIVEEVKRLMEIYKGEELSITVVGHSLGAALALLAAEELSTCSPNVPPIAVVSFGGPKVGNRAFADRLQNNPKVNALRIVNDGDLITRVPGAPAPIPRVREGYVHVGMELRLDSGASPCLRPNAGPGCCHDLEAYLHLIDGFTGSGRPFRSDARRSIVRLLQLQRSNVKKVYVNRARALAVDPAAAVVRADPYGYVASPS